MCLTQGFLTAREQDVFRLLVQGKTYREVATELYLTQNTAREYIARLYIKLGVHCRSDLITRAVELGLLELVVHL